MSPIDGLLKNIQNMGHSDRMKLMDTINGIDDLGKVTDIIESRQDCNPQCPYCNRRRIHKHGK